MTKRKRTCPELAATGNDSDSNGTEATAAPPAKKVKGKAKAKVAEVTIVPSEDPALIDNATKTKPTEVITNQSSTTVKTLMIKLPIRIRSKVASARGIGFCTGTVNRKMFSDDSAKVSSEHTSSPNVPTVEEDQVGSVYYDGDDEDEENDGVENENLDGKEVVGDEEIDGLIVRVGRALSLET